MLFFDGFHQSPHLGANIDLLGYVVAIFFFDGVGGGRGEAAGQLSGLGIALDQRRNAGALQKQSDSLISLQFQGCERIEIGFEDFCFYQLNAVGDVLFHHVLGCEKNQQRGQYNQTEDKDGVGARRENCQGRKCNEKFHSTKIQSVYRQVYLLSIYGCIFVFMETATPSVETAPVTFTKSAMDELHRLQANLALSEDAFLRIGVKGGGCSGMSYLLAFDKKEAGDNEYEVEGIKMVMNKAHVMYVLGMEVDWENGLDNRGFSFNNPNASSTCGCGQSFSA